MNTTISYLIIVFILCSLLVRAQQFSPTTGVPCLNCHPTNYTDNGMPWISDINRPGGAVTNSWNNPGFVNVLPVPPSSYSQSLPAGGGKNSFVTLHTSETGPNDQLFLTVNNFEVNKKYVFRYSVMSASVYTVNNNSPFAESATLDIRTGNQQVVTTQTTNFTSSNQNKWITRVMIFTAPSTSLEFVLSGKTAGNVAGFVNFDIDKFPYDCSPANVQVELATPTIITPFYNDHLNLSNVQIKSTAPSQHDVVWKMGPDVGDPTLTPQEATFVPVSNKNPANIKPYYGFYCNRDLNCYAVPFSQAEFKYMYDPIAAQVKLKNTSLAIPCSATTGDLTSVLDNPISGVVWFTTNDHSGTQVETPTAVPPGEYYAFYYNINRGGYALAPGALSIAHVHVGNALAPGIPDLGPTMNINSMIFPPNGSKDFVVGVQNIKAENSNCSVYFLVSKLPGFSITYSTQAGQSNVNGGMPNNNDMWTFSEDAAPYIKVTAKNGMAASASSNIGFKITRNANTPAGAKQNLAVTIPLPGGGGETNASNNQTITSLTTN